MENGMGRRKRSCPATKRNGELCEVTIVSASGYCFAHDPESAEWRAKGGRESSKKRQATKKLREMGLKHVFDTLDEALEGVRKGERSASEAMAMARVADTMLRIAEAASEREDQDGSFGWPTKWAPY